MSNLLCIHCYITGTVQGVFFRAKTKETADTLGITGWVRNLQDGRVEVIAHGEREQLSKLYEWLKKGPAKAKVTDITYEELPWQASSGFAIMPTE